MNLKGKYIPIVNYKHYWANFELPEKRDSATGQVIRPLKELKYDYHLVLDTLGNVYMIPCDENNTRAYELADIIDANRGDADALSKLDNVRSAIIREFGANLTSEKWQNILYRGVYEDSSHDVRHDFELNCCFELQKEITLPETVSNYTTLTSEQADALAKTAVEVN